MQQKIQSNKPHSLDSQIKFNPTQEKLCNRKLQIQQVKKERKGDNMKIPQLSQQHHVLEQSWQALRWWRCGECCQRRASSRTPRSRWPPVPPPRQRVVSRNRVVWWEEGVASGSWRVSWEREREWKNLMGLWGKENLM